jgi:hypothetical protein
MKSKSILVISICFLLNSCSGGTSPRVSAPTLANSSSNPNFVALTCPGGTVINALTQICPLTTDQATQLGNDAANNILKKIQ